MMRQSLPNVNRIRIGGGLRINPARQSQRKPKAGQCQQKPPDTGRGACSSTSGRSRRSASQATPAATSDQPPTIACIPVAAPSSSQARFHRPRTHRLEAQQHQHISKSLGLDAADDPFAGHVRIFIQRNEQHRAENGQPGCGSTAQLNRRQAQASSAQVSSRPTQATAGSGSSRVSQPKVQ